MFEVESILVPIDLTDPSVHTLEAAKAMADTWNAELHLLHVTIGAELNPLIELGAAAVGATPFSHEETEHVAAGHLERFIHEHFPDMDGRLRTSVAIGGVVPEVLKYAATHGIGLIVMGTRAHGLKSRLVKGSISESVLERAMCPVMLVPHRREPAKNSPRRMHSGNTESHWRSGSEEPSNHRNSRTGPWPRND
jgi:nucleotide-binding universal stress UspA family protein